jgi:inner membrane protein
MASAITHGFFAVVMGKTYAAGKMPRQFWRACVYCSVLPDLDVFGYFFGIHYGDFLGHRGFTHSLVFAFLMNLAIMLLLFKDREKFSWSWLGLGLFFFALFSSHGIIDALTDGGRGVAFFAPFDNTRYFFPWRPLLVSPIGLSGFFSAWGLEVLWSEMKWIWIPSFLLFLAMTGFRKIAFKRR